MSNITRVYELDRHIYPCSNKHAIDSFRGLSLMFAGELDEITTALEALLDKVTDIRGIDIELYAPKEIEAAKQVIKKIKEKIL
jgi:hypothetical protein